MTLWKVFVALLVSWLVLVVSRHVFGGYAHILFVAAVALGLVQILWRRRAI
ncbi:MAG: DUF5670 family protein [Acidobacteriota bacterium]